MKPILILLLSGLSLYAQSEFRTINPMTGEGALLRELESTPYTRTYEYRISEPTITSSSRPGYSAVHMGSTPIMSKPGQPKLPYFPQQFIIPSGMKIDSVTIGNERTSTVTLTAPVTFSEEMIPIGHKVEPVIRDESIYSSGSLFPTSTVELSSVQVSHGVQIAFVTLTPYQFRGNSNELVTTESCRLTLHFSPESNSRGTQNPVIRPERLNTDLLGIENPEELNRIRGTRSGGSSEAQFLIITDSSFLNALVPYTVQDLANRRRAQGMSVKVVTVDSIYNSINATLDLTPDGVIDRQMKIRYFISEAYKNWGTEYVLLAGDTNVIPVRIVNPNFTHIKAAMQYDRDLPTDYYYQCLDGTYNALYKSAQGEDYVWGSIKGAGKVIDTIVDIYGKTIRTSIDILPEVYLGRIPAENPLEFSNWLSKQFKYESMAHSDDRHRDVLIAGEYAGFTNDYNPEYNIMEYTKNSLEQIRIGGLYDTYTTRGFDAFPEIRVDTLYDGPNKDRWGLTEMLEKINSNKYGIIQHIGHGLQKYHLHLTSNDVKLMTNSRPFMVNSQACLAGRFTDDCIAERFLMDSDSSGIWAGIFNTGYGYAEGYTTDGNSHRINRNFWHGYFKSENPITNLGKLNAFGQAGLYFRTTYAGANEPTKGLYSIFSIHLLGDPTAELKLARPSEQKYLYLTSPVGGRTVLRNKSQKITWNTSENEQVSLSILAGNGSVTAVGTVMSGTGELPWTPADFVPAGTGYRMIIAGSSRADTSASFEIAEQVDLKVVDYPRDGINKKETTLISWNSDDPRVSVWVMLNGAPVQQLAEGTSETNIEWTVPKTLMGDKGYTIRLIGSKSRDRYVESEPFEIFPDIISTFPYVENFETAVSKSYVLPDFWEQSVYDDLDWQIHAGMNGIKKQCLANPEWAISGPSVDNTTGTDTGKYCYIYSRDASIGKKFAMFSPVFDLKHAKGTKLEFALHMYCSVPLKFAKFQIDVVRAGKPDTTIYLQDTVISEDKWEKKAVSLSAFDGELIKLRFTAVSGHSYASDIAVDDIRISTDSSVVAILEKQTPKTAQTTGLYVVPSVITSGETIGRIYHTTRSPFTYEWSLFDMVGNQLLTGAGTYSGSGVPVDFLDFSRFTGYSGGAVLYLKTKTSDGTSQIYKTTLGIQK